MSNEWREFEKLVSQIEKQLVPEGAIVKSPDRTKDIILWPVFDRATLGLTAGIEAVARFWV